MLSPEQASRIATIRQRALIGQASLDDYREAILILRESRRGAQAAATATKARAKKGPVDVNSLFDELDKI